MKLVIHGVVLTLMSAAFVMVTVPGLAAELRVTNAVDLVLCANGTAPLTAGPSAGATATAGDTCILDPGTFAPGAPPVAVTLPNLTMTSRSGRDVTVVIGGLSIQADGVTIESLTITGGTPGIIIGATPPTPPGQADEDIRVLDTFLNANAGAGIAVVTPAPVEDFHFESNEIRGTTGGGGILFFPAVGRVRNVEIVQNIVDTNGTFGIALVNTGELNGVLILGNEIVRSGSSGVAVGPSVTNVSDLDIDGNLIQANGFAAGTPATGSGILFANTGQVEARIVSNSRGNAGITGNACSGIFVDGAGVPGGPFAGGAVTNAELEISDNVISQNGLIGLSCPGVTFVNSGNVDDLKFIGNRVDQNSADGVFIINGSDFKGAEVKNNTMLNNGTNGPLGGIFAPFGNGFTAMPFGDLEDIVFSGNTMQGNFFHGSFLGSLRADVSNVTFSGEKYSRNGLGVPPGAGVISAGLEVASFGDVSDVQVLNSQFEQNGGSGIHLDANNNNLGILLPPAITTANAGDLTNVKLSGNMLRFNGASAPAGAGSGVLLQGDQVADVLAENNDASSNDDHGLNVLGVNDVVDVIMTANVVNNNDTNNDAVGSGIRVESNQDLEGITLKGNTGSNNQDGLSLRISGQNGGNIVIQDNLELNNNNDSGIEIEAADDLSNVQITGNTATGNGNNLKLLATDRGTNIEVSGNRFVGASGVGIHLESTGVTATNNDIRNHSVGINAKKASDSGIHNNNIVQNDIGIDAIGLGPSEELDATDNWWGEPSGPQAPSNPGGLGNKVTSKVKFTPFLSQPVGATGANFQIFDFNVQSQVAVGATLTINATIRNTGTEEGAQEIVIQIKDSLGAVVNEERQTTPLNPQAQTNIGIIHTFAAAGTFTVTVTTGTDSQTKTISVGSAPPPPPSGGSIAEALDANGNNRLDDAEILNAIVLWISGTPVPGIGQTITDEEIRRLIQMWINGAPIQ